MKKHRKILSTLVSALMLFNVTFAVEEPVILSSPEVNVDVRLYYDGNPDELYEGVLKAGKSLNVGIAVTGGQLTPEYKPVFAVYSKNSGVLQAMDILEVSESSANEILYSYTYSVPWDTHDILAKIFVFESFDTLRCLTDVIALSDGGEDNFSGDISKARTIPADIWINGMIDSSSDVDWFKFTPVATGLYGVSMTGFEGSHVLVTDGADYNNETYGDLVSIQQMRLDFTAGNDYYIKIDAIENQGSYKVSVTKLVDLQNLTASFNSTTNLITVSGNLSAGQGENISITIYNPEDNCEQVDSIESGEEGFFTYSYKTPNPLLGTYQAVVSNYLLKECGYTTFDNGTASEYVNRKSEITNAPFLMQSDAHIAIDGIVDSVDIANGSYAQANIVLTNNSSGSQQVTVGIAFYDEDNYMTDYYGIAKRVEAGETEEFYPSIDLPSDKDILKIKALIFEGAGVYGNANIMVAETVEVSDGQIKRYGQSNNTQTGLQMLSASDPVYNVTSEDKKRIMQEINERYNGGTDGGDMSLLTYTPWGIQFSQSGSKIETDVSFMSNNYFYERYFDDNTRERFIINVKNKQSHAVNFVYYVNTTYQIEDGQSYGLTGDRYFQIKAERLSANATKTLTLDLAPHQHNDTYFNPGQKFGHKIAFGVYNVGESFLNADFSDVEPVNLYPVQRHLFGNSFSNAYGITQPKDEQSSDNTTFAGYMDNSGDVDYCKFKPTVSGSYTFTSSGFANVYGELYNAYQTRLIGDNSGGSAKNTFSFTYSLTAGSTYYVKMSHNINKVTGPYFLFVTCSSSGGGGSSGSLTVQNLRYTAGPKLGNGNLVSLDVKNTMSSTQSFRAVAYVNWPGQQRVEKMRTTLKSVGANQTASVNVPEFSMYSAGANLTTSVEIVSSSGTVLTSASRTNTVAGLGGNVEPQKLEFTKEKNNRYYLFDDNHERIRFQDVASNDNPVEPTTIAHYDDLQQGTYTFFAYHHRGSDVPSNKTLYYEPVFYNDSASGQVEMKKIGYSTSWGWEQVWADYSGSAVDRPAFHYNAGDPAESDDLSPQSSNYNKHTETVSAGTKKWFSDFLTSGQVAPINDVIWIMMEFEVKNGGSVKFETVAYTTDAHTSPVTKNSLQIGSMKKGNYIPDQQYKGKAENGPLVSAALEYYIDDTVPNNTVLPVRIFNQFYPNGNLSWDGRFTTNTNSYHVNNWQNADDSNMMSFNYTDSDGRQWIFNPFRNDGYTNGRYNNSVMPTPSTGPVAGQSPANISNYGVTNHYTIRIHNAGNLHDALGYKIFSQGRHIYKYTVYNDDTGSVISSKMQTLKEVYFNDEVDVTEVIDIPILTNGNTRIEFDLTMTTGCNGTINNYLIVK
jgi:hypothetical protein